ncbi:MAG: ribonuclease domain-containing protein [Caldilineaceae bacterium]
MSRGSQKPGGNRRLSLGTLIVVLGLMAVIYWQTGTLPTEVLDAVLGEGTPITLATQDAPPTATDTATATVQPTTVAQATATPVPPTAEDRAVVAPTDTSIAAAGHGDTHIPANPRPTPTATATPQRSRSGLPTVAFDDLPVQAQETIELIDAGGPFPFSRDGIIFQNRERILPLHNQGYYHEYTP